MTEKTDGSNGAAEANDSDETDDTGGSGDTDESSESTPELAADAQGRFPVPEYDDLPADLQKRITEETQRAGFTPNVFAALAYRPAQFRAFVAYHDALVEETALDRAEVEMIVVAVSGRNHCYCCNVAHGALVRIYARDPHLADQLVANYRQADVSDRRLVIAEQGGNPPL